MVTVTRFATCAECATASCASAREYRVYAAQLTADGVAVSALVHQEQRLSEWPVRGEHFGARGHDLAKDGVHGSRPSATTRFTGRRAR